MPGEGVFRETKVEEVGSESGAGGKNVPGKGDSSDLHWAGEDLRLLARNNNLAKLKKVCSN